MIKYEQKLVRINTFMYKLKLAHIHYIQTHTHTRTYSHTEKKTHTNTITQKACTNASPHIHSSCFGIPSLVRRLSASGISSGPCPTCTLNETV